MKKYKTKSALVKVLPDSGRRDRRVLELRDPASRGGTPIEFYVWPTGAVSVLDKGEGRSRLVVTVAALRALADSAELFLARGA